VRGGIINTVKLQLTVGMIGDNQEIARKEIVMGTKTYSLLNLAGILELSGRLRPVITC